MRHLATALLGVTILATMVGWTSMRPSNRRDWLPEQQLLPRAEIGTRRVTIHNVRNFRWGPGDMVRPAWDTRTYDLDGVRSVWYVLTPFSRDRRGPAHAFVSFGFDDGRYISISVEARRELNEPYSVGGGMLKRYEVMYVVGDEADLIHLRVGRGDDVYVYPLRASPARARALLVDMLTRANALRERPEFYGTIRNNCTTNLLAHVNTLTDRPIRYGRRILLPGYSDEGAYERGLIATDLPHNEARQKYLVNDRALLHPRRDGFSEAIRRHD
jgi:hypothetical protein